MLSVCFIILQIELRLLASPPHPTFKPSGHLLPTCLPAPPMAEVGAADCAGRQKPPTPQLCVPNPLLAIPTRGRAPALHQPGHLGSTRTGTPDLPSRDFEPPRPRAILRGRQQHGSLTRAEWERALPSLATPRARTVTLQILSI